MAFVTPSSAARLQTAAARRSTVVCRKPSRTAPVMKKVRRSATTGEDENAVNVFAPANVSQEDLLASALGDTPSQPISAPKKKPKGKKANTLAAESNAVDVFGGTSLSQEQLLANAMGEQPLESPMQTKKKKKSKAKKGDVLESDNAVDVFGASNLSQKDLLEKALGKTEATPLGDHVSKSKKKARSSNMNSIDLKPRENTLSDFEGETVADITFGSRPKSNAPDHHQLSVGPDANVDALDDFEPETEVVNEFEDLSKQFKNFTSHGRRQNHISNRGERNAIEGKLANVKYAHFGTGSRKFVSVRLEDVTMVFRNTHVLQGATWGVRSGDRVGLIGENGSGKSTLLRIIAGTLTPTSGEVVRSSSRVKSSFLRQEFVDELDPTRTLREEFYSAFTEELKVAAEYEQCENAITRVKNNMDELQTLLNDFEALREKCEEMDVWNLDSRIDKVMPGLGFAEDDDEKLVAAFSGGWKVRIGLGKVLLQNPDLLLLDEPSNHLDSESVEWLEGYLQRCKLPMVVVSHDREFLDKVCTKIVDIEGGEAFEYPGNYSRFVKLKKEQRKAWESAYERQQKFIKEQESYIKRNRKSPARSGQVKSRQKMLERMERTGQLVRSPPRQGKPLVFRFPRAPRSGRDCIVVDELTHGYSGKTLFRDSSIAIERGDRIALIGPNGSGKSTLLRLIVGLEKAQYGNVQCGELTNVKVAYYEQNQADALDLEITVLETLKLAAPSDMRYEEIRALLGKFLFKGDSVQKEVSALSGGEKARLALAKIMLEPANVLILDEPGNHLSISAKEMLEEALQHFDGTLLLVSHDRYLISQVATQIIAVEDKSLVLYDGDYKSYMETHEELRERLQARFIPGVAEIKNAPKIMLEDPVEAVGKRVKRKKTFGGSGINSGKTKEMNAKRWTQ